MIIIYTFLRRYIHIVKVLFCSQYSLVSTQYSFILQRIFHNNSYNRTGMVQYIESLSQNRKEAMRSALIHQKFSKNSPKSLILVKDFLKFHFAHNTLLSLHNTKIFQVWSKPLSCTRIPNHLIQTPIFVV